MNARDFIIEKINELVLLFPNTRCRYENHFITNSHFIEVVPNRIYSFDEKFQQWEEKVTFEFIEKFPKENICFISDDAVVGIENADYEISGKLFENVYSFNKDCYQLLTEITVHTAFQSQLISNLIAERPLPVLSEITDSSLKITNIPFIYFTGVVGCFDVPESIIEQDKEIDFAKAA